MYKRLCVFNEIKERAIPQRVVLKLAVTDSAVNRIISDGEKFCCGKLESVVGMWNSSTEGVPKVIK
ncbi:hypothetical protein HMPREF1207_05534 [Paenibacillus sp. HGH0039]|nr:hypothetical protein HMPREF1207_05534 [Paenibacillus sp. HGH0039]